MADSYERHGRRRAFADSGLAAVGFVGSELVGFDRDDRPADTLDRVRRPLRRKPRPGEAYRSAGGVGEAKRAAGRVEAQCRVREERLQRAGEDEIFRAPQLDGPIGADDDEYVGGSQHELHVVAGRHDETGGGVCDAPERAHDRGARGNVEERGRLVEDHHVGSLRERAGYCRPLPLAVADLRHPPLSQVCDAGLLECVAHGVMIGGG